MIKSFGCSFFYGSELSDCPGNSIFDPSQLTWPALVAKHKQIEYQCYARPGKGNLFIANRIMEQPPSDDIFLINWTWIDRFDYVNAANELWEVLRPGESGDLEKFYFRHLHSEYRDVLTNLGYIKLALDYLLDNKIKFVMTYMDYLLFTPMTLPMHQPSPVNYLQKQIKPYVTDFSGKNFLDWAKDNNYHISSKLHPLEEAHLGASQYMIENQII